MLFTEEQVKKLAAQIHTEWEKQKENKTTESQETLVLMEKMIKDQVELTQKAQQERRSGEFQSTDFGDPDALDKSVVQMLSGMDSKALNGYRNAKILTSMKTLELMEGRDVGQKIEQFKEMNDTAYLVASVLSEKERKSEGSAGRSFMDVYRDTKQYKMLQNFLKQNPDMRKALAVANTGYGAEWVPTGFSSQVMVNIELQLKVGALFNSFPMPTNPYKLPVQASNATGYLISESTADEATKITASSPGTTNVQFSAKKLADRVVFSEEIDEDSIVAIRSFVTAEMGKALARAEETAIINGHETTAALHQDNVGASVLFSSTQDPRLAWHGLRYFGLNNADTPRNDYANSSCCDVAVRTTITKLGKYAVNPNDCAFVLPVRAYLQFLGMTNVQTVDKYGPSATILSGEVMKYAGIPVLVSEYAFSNINASGKYDGTTTNRSQVILVYRPGFYIGTRGGVTLNSEVNIQTDQIILVAKRRMDFVDIYVATVTGMGMVALGYNVYAA